MSIELIVVVFFSICLTGGLAVVTLLGMLAFHLALHLPTSKNRIAYLFFRAWSGIYFAFIGAQVLSRPILVPLLDDALNFRRGFKGLSTIGFDTDLLHFLSGEYLLLPVIVVLLLGVLVGLTFSEVLFHFSHKLQMGLNSLRQIAEEQWLNKGA